MIIIVFGTLVGLLSGYFRGPVDAVLRPLMELVWSFPPVILGVVVGTALAFGGIGPIKGNSIFIPALIIGVIYVPYLGKPIRGEVLRLREQDFVDAARVQGMSPWRIMVSEILPNAASTITVFVPMMLANAILLEAYLSFLGAGVQAPNASWGTLISDGLNYISTTPTFSLDPGRDARAHRAQHQRPRRRRARRAGPARPGADQGPDGPFHRPALAVGDRAAVRDLVRGVRHLRGDPELQPGAGDRRAQREPDDGRTRSPRSSASTSRSTCSTRTR